MSELRIDWPDAGLEDVETALAGLRQAGRELRERGRDSIIEALAQVLERFRDPDSVERTALQRSLPDATGFTPEVVERGLALGLADWTGEAFGALVKRELESLERGGRSRASGFATTSVLLAGAIPMPALPAILLPLVLRSPVLVRPGARDRTTALQVARAIASVDPQLGRCVAVTTFPVEDQAALTRFLSSECVVASGGDGTLGAIAQATSPTQRLVGYGHRSSISVLGEGATSGEELRRAARGLALDVALWDQLGCLSPLAVFVEAPDESGCTAVGRAIAEALGEAARTLPRGEVSPAASAAIATERAEAEMRIASGRAVSLHGAADGSWTVVCEDTAAWRSAPLHRFLRIHPVPDRASLLAALRPVGRHLSAVAIAGFSPSQQAELARSLGETGASRICAPGSLQAPPLGWNHDGRSPFSPLAHITDLEIG